MEQQRVDAYIIANQKFFPSTKMMLLKDRLTSADDSRYAMLMSVELKDPTTMLLISIFLGVFGVDRFMLGDTGMGVLKLLTGGLCGILAIIDWFSISDKTKELNFNKTMAIF